MDDKRNSLLTIGLVCAVLLVLGVANLWNSDRVYSEAENRVLASRPAFSWESLFTGEYGDAYEKYMSDQFVGRDKWVGLKTRADIRFRKKEINGVYLGADHYLIGVNDPDEYTEQMENSRVASLTKLVNHWDAKVMLVPTADNILTDKLPAFAPYYDEERLLTKVRNSIGEEHYIDVYYALQEHAQEPIYYRTDHHWTSLGAYYGRGQAHLCQGCCRRFLGDAWAARISQTVHQGLTALVEGSPDQGEHLLLILHLYRRFFVAGQADDRAAHIRSRDEAVGRYIRHDFRLCIILHRQRQGAVILRAGAYLHTVRHFLLHHDGDALQRHTALE